MGWNIPSVSEEYNEKEYARLTILTHLHYGDMHGFYDCLDHHFLAVHMMWRFERTVL
jgi:hypothetical protein